MGHTRTATFVGSAGRWVAACWACCGPGAAYLDGEWWCVAWVYRLHGGGRAVGSGMGWVCGRLPAGSGCRGLTVGGRSAVSSWCVPWCPLVGWLRGFFGVYRIHGGTTVCWRVVVGCGGGGGVGAVLVVGGGASCVVPGGSSWWFVVAVRGGWSWAWRFWEGAGLAGSGWFGGGGRVCVGWCVRPLLPLRFLPEPFPCLSPCACSFFFVFAFGGGGCVWLGVFGAGRGRGCVPVPVLMWVWVS